jgi:hypothetical protein
MVHIFALKHSVCTPHQPEVYRHHESDTIQNRDNIVDNKASVSDHIAFYHVVTYSG